jgi:hypothetical protein
MGDVAWELEHSVEADASSGFVWSFWTDVTNWDDPPAQFALDGPFAAGARGTTVLPGQEPVRWTLRDVRAGQSFTLEMQLDGATLSFEWRFDAVSDRRTRLTQRIVLSGDNARAHTAAVQAGFGPTLSEGMNRIAGLLARAEARSRGDREQ